MIVLDIEATCWADSDPLKQVQSKITEPIEIGAVKIGARNSVISEFQTFIRPEANPVLTDFCKSLTSITQQDVDLAPNFKEAWRLFLNWVGDDITLMTWGEFDHKILSNKAREMSLDYYFFHLNAKSLFGNCGLGKAAKKNNLKFSGAQHRAIVDARMIANIYIKNY